MPARLVLDELDFDFSALASWLVVIIIIVVGGRARALGAAVCVADTEGAIAVVVDRRRRVLVVVGDFRGHGGECWAGDWIGVFGVEGPKLFAVGCGEDAGRV